MKRTILAAALCAALSSSAFAADSAIPAAAGANAVAFDQIDIISMSTYGSSPTDFSRDASALAAAATDAKGMATIFPAKTLKRFAFYHGATRVETVALHSVVITKPGEVDVLDTQKKTYKKTTGDALKALPITQGGFGLPAFPGASPQSSTPGTMDLAMSIDASAIDTVMIEGQSAKGYRVAIGLSSANATGSCTTFARFANLNGTIDNYAVNRPEPASSIASSIPAPAFTVQDFMKIPGFDPKGCAIDSMSVQVHHLATAGALAGFYLYRRIVFVPGAGSPISISPTIVSERGNIRDLTEADVALFTIPADYTPAT